MTQLIISIRSKSFSENPVFSEIGVRMGCVANLINCNVGFVCISLPAVKVKHSNLGQRCGQASCYFFLSGSAARGVSTRDLPSALKKKI